MLSENFHINFAVLQPFDRWRFFIQNCIIPIERHFYIHLYSPIIYKKLQAIYLMLYKRYKTAKIKKYKHEHVLAYTFNLSSVARINV